MKYSKKGLIRDILILVAPVVIILLLMPVLPDKIPIHRGLVDRYIDKKYAFILGILPFVIYKLKYEKR